MFLIVLAAVVFVTGQIAAGQAVSILVHADVENVEVLVDGTSKGRTGPDQAFVIEGVLPGAYVVTVRKTGFRDQSQTVTIDESGLDRVLFSNSRQTIRNSQFISSSKPTLHWCRCW